MKILLRTLLLLLPLALIGPAAARSDADDVEPHDDARGVVIPELLDLRAELAAAGRAHLPLLVLFSADYCRYCTVVKNDFLKPMMYSGDYEGKVLFRMVTLRAGRELVDVDGRRIDAREFADRYEVRVTPTLVFIDAQGRQVAEKMVGLTTPDFFGGYLDDAITTAHHRVRNGSTLACKNAQPQVTC